MSTGVSSPYRSFSPFESLEVGKRLNNVASGDNDAFALGPCRGLLVGSGGLMNGWDITSTYFLGAPIPSGWSPLGIMAVGSGTLAADVWAVY
jgi:hypothetical protein